MATGFNTLGVDMSTHNYSDEELSKMPTMEQLIVASRIRNQQMLQMLGLGMTPKQHITKVKKSRKETNNDVNWTPDLAAEEDSGQHYCAAARKSSVPTIKPGSSANNSTNPSPSPVLSLQATVPTTPLTKYAHHRIRNNAAQTTSTDSEKNKPTSPSTIIPDTNDHQNHSSQTITLDSASRKTPETTTGPTAWVQPFTGFAAEQIDAARQRSFEAQNRKEAIARLMRAKLINKDDLAIIEPVDRKVLQAVLQRRQQEAKEQQKHEQRQKFAAGRYPRRNDSRKNYHESSEDDEILDEDTINIFSCDKCKKDNHEGHSSCPIHHNALGHLDIVEPDNRPQSYNVVKSLPEGLLVKESPIPGAGRGVYTGQFTTLCKDMIYGPYEGVRVYNEREAHQSGYCWQIYSNRKISHWVDARQVCRANWLRCIKCAATTDRHNVCAYQVGQNIYYRTVADIGPDTELLVWYGEDYARELGLHSMAFMASISSITLNGAYLVCWDCQLEFRCRQRLNQHKFTAHDTVNSNSVAFVGKTRCATNTVATRQVRGSVAKSGLLAIKPCIAGSACSEISRVAVSPCSTGSDARIYKQQESYIVTNERCGASSARLIDPDVNKCQVPAGSGCACVSSSGALSGIDVSRVVVTDDGPCFRCSTCRELFESRAQMIQHTRIHTGDKPLECSNCGDMFKQNAHLVQHSRIHTGEKPFECSNCGDRFKQKAHLVQHSRIHTGEKPFQCATCGQIFTLNSSLTRHSRIHTGEKPFACSNCGDKFKQNGHLTQHSRIHNGEKPFGCTTCGQRFTLNGNLTRHSLIHTGEKPFQCATCGQIFTLNSSLTRHSRIHTGEKPFECSNCGDRFKQNGHLTQHSRIHNGEKPFGCTTCGQRFTLNGNLTRHSLIHTGEKRFECTTCGQKFTVKGDLNKHSLIHTGDKPFECTACGKRFTHRYNLTKHSRTHTGVKPFECTACGRRFTQSYSLIKHSRIHWRKTVHV